MPTKLYVGNLSFNTTENDLQDLFATVGPVTEVLLMQDRVTGKSRGFGFVTMATEQDAANAVTQFHGKTVEGRALTVNEARPREERSRRRWRWSPCVRRRRRWYGGGGGGRWRWWRLRWRRRRSSSGGGGGYGGGGGGGGRGGDGGGDRGGRSSRY